jgi:hypothetical protein
MISHEPTGYGVLAAPTREEASRAVEYLLQLNWNFQSPNAAPRKTAQMGLVIKTALTMGLFRASADGDCRAPSGENQPVEQVVQSIEGL